MDQLFLRRVFLSILLWSICGSHSQTVVTVDNCTCTDTSDGGVYSLWPIRGTGGRPRFVDIPGNKYPNWLYAYNPCTPFDFGKLQSQDENYCKNVAICQYPKLDRSGNYHPIGMQKDFACEKNKDRQIQMLYPTGDSDPSYGPSTVVLLCDPSVSTPVFLPTDQDNYIFSLRHRCACKNQCSPGPTKVPSSPRPPIPASSTILPTASSTTKGPTTKLPAPGPTKGPSTTNKNTSHGFVWIYLTVGAVIIVIIVITGFLLWKCHPVCPIGDAGQRARLLNNDTITNYLKPENRDANCQNITQNNDTVPKKKKFNNEKGPKMDEIA